MKTIVTLPAQVAFSLLVTCFFVLAPAAAWAQSAAAKGEAREVLSVGWQAGYCAARPKSKGCAGFSSSADAAQRFSLVGRFQPRKSYCGIEAGLAQKAKKGAWTDLPEVSLASATKDRLMAAMPAARSGFDRRLWLKSGSCVAASAEAYYGRSLDLLDQLNASPVLTVLTRKAGGTVTLAEVRTAVDTAFGAGAGERVRLTCRKAGNRTVVTGLTIGIAAGEGTLTTLIAGAKPTTSRCTEGWTGIPTVDRAALQ
jgi:ribonuclease T2